MNGGIEDNLFDFLKNVSMSGGGGSISFMLNNMIRAYELNMLHQIEEMVKSRIEYISRQSSPKWNVNEDMNPLTILGVTIESTREEVDKAYKEKAWNAHPDHGGSNMDMAKVNAAYEAIKKVRGWN